MAEMVICANFVRKTRRSIRMKRFFKTVVILFSSFATLSCLEDANDIIEDVVKVGDRLPDFEVEMNDGTTITGAQLRTTTSVVVFFYTPCPDCQKLLPCVQQVYDKYTSQGVAFALISRAEGAETIEKYWLEHGFTMPYSAQEDRTIYELFARVRVPRVYISTKEGTVNRIFTDDPVPTVEELEAAIEPLL